MLDMKETRDKGRCQQKLLPCCKTCTIAVSDAAEMQLNQAKMAEVV